MLHSSLYAISFHLNIICEIRSRFRRHRADIDPDSNDIISKEIPFLIKTLKYTRDLCKRHKLPDSADRIQNAEHEVSFLVDLWKINGDTDALIEKVLTQLDLIDEIFARESRKHQFAHITPIKAQLLLSIESQWSHIWKNFPSVEAPSRAAIEAYAVGLNEASVYHMMMAVEPGLKTLARRLRVKYDRQVWDAIIADIKNALRVAVGARRSTPKGSRPPSPAAAARLRADITLFSEAAIEFVWFKEAWRNHVAHGRAKYDENDALKVITHVHGFMERLSTRLRERR